MLADHHPVTHQEEVQNTQTSQDSGQNIVERSEIRQISDSVPVDSVIPEEQCTQHIVHFIDAQDQSDSGSEIRQISDSVPVHTVIPEEQCAQHIVHSIDAQDQSDSGSLTTQAPQSSSIRATINALSTWISAVQPRESWYLAGWVKD